MKTCYIFLADNPATRDYEVSLIVETLKDFSKYEGFSYTCVNNHNVLTLATDTDTYSIEFEVLKDNFQEALLTKDLLDNVVAVDGNNALSARVANRAGLSISLYREMPFADCVSYASKYCSHLTKQSIIDVVLTTFVRLFADLDIEVLRSAVSVLDANFGIDKTYSRTESLNSSAYRRYLDVLQNFLVEFYGN